MRRDLVSMIRPPHRAAGKARDEHAENGYDLDRHPGPPHRSLLPSTSPLKHFVGWHEHDPRLFHGTERFFKPGYRAHLVEDWIPALDGVKAKLEAGAEVADIGCGHGASTVIMAEAFPNSQFKGFDYHDGSIEQARQRAESAGVGERVEFETASAADYPGNG